MADATHSDPSLSLTLWGTARRTGQQAVGTLEQLPRASRRPVTGHTLFSQMTTCSMIGVLWLRWLRLAETRACASFFVYKWMKQLPVGQGSDMFGILLAAGTASAWADCIMGQEPLFFYHDDVWISMWLRIRGVKFTFCCPPMANQCIERSLCRDAGLATHDHTSILARDRLGRI